MKPKQSNLLTIVNATDENKPKGKPFFKFAFDEIEKIRKGEKQNENEESK